MGVEELIKALTGKGWTVRIYQALDGPVGMEFCVELFHHLPGEFAYEADGLGRALQMALDGAGQNSMLEEDAR